MKSIGYFKLLAAVLLLSMISVNSFAQVRIGANADPDPNAMLDLRGPGTDATSVDNKGVLFPRVALQTFIDVTPFGGVAPKEGMTVYNIGVSGAPISKGVYVWNGTRWTLTNRVDGEWFYMPPVLIPTDLGPNNINLYTRYNQALQNDATMPKSPGAPALTNWVENAGASSYYYYVPDYDKDVFSDIQIDANGNMTYNVMQAPDEETFIHVVFVKK